MTDQKNFPFNPNSIDDHYTGSFSSEEYNSDLIRVIMQELESFPIPRSKYSLRQMNERRRKSK